MAYDIGPKIGIDGEAEFRAQISKVSTTIRTLGTEMQVVTSAFAGQERSTEALIAQNNVLSRTVTALEDKLSQQKEMLARCASEYGENSEKTQRWQQIVNQTQAELNRANAQIDANEQALRDNGETVEDTAEKHESAMSKIGAAAKAGLGAAAEALKAVGTVAIAAVGAATTAVAGLVKASVEGYAEYEQLVGGVETLFGTGGKSMQEFAEEQGKTVDAIKGEYDRLQDAQEQVFDSAYNAYKTAGLSANEYMETVTSFSAALISSLGGDTAKAASVADKAIVDMADNANKMGSSMESIQNAYQGFAKQNYTMLDNLKLGYGGTKEEMQRLLADAEKISGQKFDLSSYADVVEAIHVVQTEMGITGTTAKEASTTIEGSIGAAKAAWQNFLLGLSSPVDFPLEEQIDNLVDSVVTAFGNILPVVLRVLESIGTAIQDFAPVLAETLPTLIEDVLPSMLEAGVSLVAALVSGLGSALPSIVTAIGQVVGLLISGLESALPKIKEEGPSAIKSFTTGVTQALPDILAVAASIIVQLIEGLTANLPALVDSAATILGSLASGLGAQLPTLVPVALDMILTLVNSLINNADDLIDGAIALLNGLAGGLINSIPIIAKKAPDIVGGLVNAIVENVPKMLTAAVSLLQNLATGIIDNLPELGNAAGEIIGKITSGINELRENILNIGRNIVAGVWEGISGKVEWFTEQVKGFFGGIIDGVKELLGIQSPSKVFQKEIGENIGLGVAKGIQDSQETAVSAANLMAQSVYKASKNWLDRNAKYLGMSLSDQLEVWQTIQGQFIESSQQWADAQVEILELQKKIQEEHDNNIIESTKKVVERQNLSLSEQLALWENAQSQLLDSSKQFAEAEKQVYKLREAVAEEHANNIIESTKKVVERQNLSLNEQLGVWENAQGQLLEGSKQFAEAEEQVYKLRKAVAEEFSNTANSLLDEAMKTQEKYDDALSKRTESLYNIYGLFDEASKGEAVNGEKLLSNLEGQIDSMESFYAGLAELSGRGVSDELVDEIRAMGPKAAEELEGLLTMSDDQLEKYNQIYNEKRRLAADLAVEELTELKNETDQKVNETLNELTQLFDSQAPELGSSLTSGLADGIRSGSSEVVNSVISMAKAAIEAAKSTLMIHSPSQVFSDIGENMALGMSKGWTDKFKGVKENIQDSLKFDMGQVTLAQNMPGLTLGVERPNYQDLFAGMVNGIQTATAGNDFPQSATIVLQAGDGMTLARWLLPDLRAAMRDDPAQ